VLNGTDVQVDSPRGAALCGNLAKCRVSWGARWPGAPGPRPASVRPAPAEYPLQGAARWDLAQTRPPDRAGTAGAPQRAAGRGPRRLGAAASFKF
jgi:hypothetical protein